MSHAGPRQRLGTELNLFKKKTFGRVPCVWGGAVFPCSVKGWADRQTYKQAAFISVRETWQQRAQLPGLPSTTTSTIPLFPLFYLFCHHLTAPKRWNGEDRGALNLCFLSVHCLFTGNHFTVWPTDWTMLQKLQLLYEWFSQAVWKQFWLFYSNKLNYICDSVHICFHINFT